MKNSRGKAEKEFAINVGGGKRRVDKITQRA